MSTIVIDIDDKSSAKLFMELARKLHFKARVLTEQQKVDWALWSMTEERSNGAPLPVETALKGFEEGKIQIA